MSALNRKEQMKNTRIENVEEPGELSRRSHIHYSGQKKTIPKMHRYEHDMFM